MERLAAEGRSARSGAAQALASGLFRAPAVIDESPGRLVFERVTGVGLEALARAHPMALQRFEQLGRAVAALHERPLPPGGRMLQSRLPAPGRPVWLHGDLALQNVIVDERGEIVLLDWSPAAWLGEGEIGPESIDVAMILMSVFHRNLLNSLAPSVEKQAAAVWRGYQEVARPDWPAAALAPLIRSLLARFWAFRVQYAPGRSARVVPGTARLLSWLLRFPLPEIR